MQGAASVMPGSNEQERNEQRHNLRRCLHLNAVIQYHKGNYDQSIDSSDAAIGVNRTY